MIKRTEPIRIYRGRSKIKEQLESSYVDHLSARWRMASLFQKILFDDPYVLSRVKRGVVTEVRGVTDRPIKEGFSAWLS